MSRIQTLLIAGITGVSCWLSMGVIAVTGADVRARVFALPPVWLLGVIVAIAVVIAWLLKPPARRLSPLLLTVLLWLPYVPGSVPAVFLIWEGPIEIGVWVIVGMVTVIGGRWKPKLTKAPAHPGLAPITAAVIAAGAYAFGAAALRDQLPIGDEPHYLMMTQSLIKDGDLRIENNHQNRDYAAFATFDLPIHYLTRGADGQIYSAHAPGVAILVLPAFALFGYYGAVATVILCVAIASAIAWHAAWLLTAHLAAAWLTWAAVFLTAPIYLQAIMVFPDAVAALPVMAGVWLLIALEVGRPVSDRLLIGVALALASLPWLHSRFAVLAGGLGIAIALRLLAYGWRRVATFFAVPAVMAVLWLGFFWWIWGSPSPFAPWGSGMTSKIQWLPRGVYGLLFDPQAGLLVPAPVYLLAFAGWIALLQVRARLALETASIFAMLLASVAPYEAWWGGQGAPARYLVAALPLLAAPLAAVSSRRLLTRAAAIGVTISLLLLTAKVFAAGGAFAFNPETGVNPLFAWMSPSASPPTMTITQTASELAFVQRWDPYLLPRDGVDLTIPMTTPMVPAQKASRLSAFRVFFLDRHSQPEPTGFWVIANMRAALVIDGDDAARHLGLRLQAGPVPTTAEVIVDGKSQSFSFAPRQRHEMAIPPSAAGAWKITIRPGAGFKPRDHDPRLTDARNLGIWIEVF